MQPMRQSVTSLVLAALCLGGLAGHAGPLHAQAAAEPARTVHPPERAGDDAGIAWSHAASDADVDAAFRTARLQSKPVFMYWGATWCPPCNQVKSTLFNRQDFIARSRAFVPVYIDGDSPGAQKLGARFKVSGYPTMVLFTPQGAELTRLPGEVDAERYNEVLTLGMNSQRPIRTVLEQARRGGSDLGADDWRLLAFYAWDTDQQQLVPKADVGRLLQQLADACPAALGEIALRLRLKALAAGARRPAPDRVAARQLLALLDDPVAARSQMDLLANSAVEITQAVSHRGSPQRAVVLQSFDTALRRFEADATLSRADRLNALIARVDLSKLDVPKPAGARAGMAPVPAALLNDVRDQAAAADRQTTDGFERQSVITAAAYLLQDAGLTRESDELLRANLSRSHSPYYLMSELASNARARGDTAQALHWYEQAFEHSVGPATRLQWGSSFVSALVELSPHDEARIETVAAELLTEAATQSDAFYERSGRSLQRLGSKLALWNRSGAHQATLQRLQARLDGVCSALEPSDPHRATCAALFKPAVKPSA